MSYTIIFEDKQLAKGFFFTLRGLGIYTEGIGVGEPGPHYYIRVKEDEDVFRVILHGIAVAQKMGDSQAVKARVVQTEAAQVEVFEHENAQGRFQYCWAKAGEYTITLRSKDHETLRHFLSAILTPNLLG